MPVQDAKSSLKIFIHYHSPDPAGCSKAGHCYPVESVNKNKPRYLLESDLSHLPFEQHGRVRKISKRFYAREFQSKQIEGQSNTYESASWVEASC